MTKYLLIILIVALNIATSIYVLRDDRRLGYEKAAEIGLIWILPVAGALVSIGITLHGPEKVREYEAIEKFFRRSG